MREADGDLWSYVPEGEHVDARLITTNGVTAGDVEKGTWHAVMGRGVAEQAVKRFPKLDSYFALWLKERGNVPMALIRAGNNVQEDPILGTFPVKHHWRDRADLALIEQSARLVVELADREAWDCIVLPRPGCGNGGRDWEGEVRPIIEDILDDRFVVVFEPGHDRRRR